jgi:hypothetical protein
MAAGLYHEAIFNVNKVEEAQRFERPIRLMSWFIAARNN